MWEERDPTETENRKGEVERQESQAGACKHSMTLEKASEKDLGSGVS